MTASPSPCTLSWVPQSSQSWLRVSGSGNGSGSFGWVADANPSASQRTATITVGSTTITVTQQALLPPPDCVSVTLSNPSPIAYGGGSGTITVTASPSPCVLLWTPESSQSWLAVSGSGSASGSFTWAASANPGTTQRTATVTVGSTTITVTQQPAPPRDCTSLALSNPSPISKDGGSGVISVSGAPAGCTLAWTPSSNQGWFRVTGNGNGSGSFTWVADANPTSSSRVAIVTVGTATITITQDSTTFVCTSFILSNPGTIAKEGGSGLITVTGTPIGCLLSWVPASDAAQTWFRVSGSGNGSGSFTWTADPNPGANSRSSTITVGTATLVVTQAGTPTATCNQFLFSGGTQAAPEGQTLTIGVTPQPSGCTTVWSPQLSPSLSWATIVSGGGTGAGSVRVQFQPNATGSQRGTLLIVGSSSVSLSQGTQPCVLTLGGPSPASLPAAGGPGTINVTVTPTGCALPYAVSANDAWLLLQTASGVGSGTITYKAQANNTTAARSTVITAGGRTAAIQQDAPKAADCVDYQLSVGGPAGQAGFVPNAGGTGTVTVRGTPGGCQTAWTATSNSGWLEISGSSTGQALSRTTHLTLRSGRSVAAAQGQGDGSFVYSVTSANPGPGKRVAYVSVNGRALAIEQDAPPPAPLSMVTSSLPSGMVGRAYSAQLQVTGGTAPYVFSATNLPAGLRLGSNSGLVEGTPELAGISSVTFRVTDSGVPAQSLSRAFGIEISEVPCTFELTPAQVRAGSLAETATLQLTASQRNCAWVGEGLPGWVNLDPASGSGSASVKLGLQPNMALQARQASIRIAGQAVSVEQAAASVAPPLVVSPQSLYTKLRQGEKQQLSLSVLSGTAQAEIAYAASLPAAPRWLSLASAGSRTPSAINLSIDAAGLTPGRYQARVTVSAPGADPALRQVDLTIDVDPLQPAKLSALPAAVLLGGREGTELQHQNLVLENVGEQGLSYSAQPLSDWIQLGDQGSVQGDLQARGRVTVPMIVDVSKLPAGAYRSSIRLTSATTLQSIDIPVAVVLAAVEKPRLDLSQQGLTMLTGTEFTKDMLTVPVGVLNTGAGTLTWTASTGTPWLRLVNPSGEAVANSNNIRRFEVGFNTSEVNKLGAGRYEGAVRVDSPEGGSRDLKVTLDKRGAYQLPFTVAPTGLVFVSEEGGVPPASQEVKVYSRSLTRDLQVSVTQAAWIEPAMKSFTLKSGAEAAVRFDVKGSTSNPGTYRDAVRISADGQTVEVQVAWMIVPRGTLTSLSCSTAPPVAALTSLPSDFVISAGDPIQLVATALDGCGSPLTEGSVVASFSNGDSPLGLRPIGDGAWEGTWVPKRDAADRVVVRVIASAAGAGDKPPEAAEGFSVAGILQPNIATPAIEDNGVVNLASPGESGAPLAPGTWVTINGLNLANAPTNADGNPLPSRLGETSVSFGGRELPLLQVNSAQVLAQLPYDADSGLTSQLVVRRGQSASAPESVAIASSTPRVFTTDGSGQGQGVIVDAATGLLAGDDSPLSAGQRVYIYAAGLGAVTPLIEAGSAAPPDALPSVVNPVRVLFDGIPAQVESAVLASSDLQGAEKWLERLRPAYVGIYRITAIVPEGLTPGTVRMLVVSGEARSLPISLRLQ